MPKLRDDLLRNLSPDDQELMKILRRRPLKAYLIEELLPPNATFAQTALLRLRLINLTEQKPPLAMVIKDGEKTYYAKAKRAVSLNKKPRSR